KATLRALLSSTDRPRQSAFVQAVRVEAVRDEAVKRILELTTKKRRVSFENMHSLVSATFQEINERFANPTPVSGLPTGFHDLDQMTAGLHPSTLNVLAARPSMGKTALGLNIILNAALKGGAAVGIFSLEMSAIQL